MPSPAVVAAWERVGKLPTEKVPLWAAYWIAAGYDGEHLVQLAGLHGDDPLRCPRCTARRLAVCGVAMPLGRLFDITDEWGAGWGRSEERLAAVVRDACERQLRDGSVDA
jgi:hypothetical protein